MFAATLITLAGRPALSACSPRLSGGSACLPGLDPESREESIHEGIATCLFAYERLHAQGRAHVATASTLAWYSSRQVKRGRPAAGRMNGKDVLSRYAQIGNDFRAEFRSSSWLEEIVHDQRASIVDQVAASSMCRLGSPHSTAPYPADRPGSGVWGDDERSGGQARRDRWTNLAAAADA